MATIGMSYREGPAMRMHCEQLEKVIRRDVERDRADLGHQLALESQENSRRIVEAARATGAVVTNVWVDHPAAEGA